MLKILFTVSNIGTFFKPPYIFGGQNLSSDVEYRGFIQTDSTV